MSLLVLATKWLTSITLPIRPSTSYDLVTLTDYSHLHCVSLTLFKFQFLCVSQSSVCYVLWLPVVIFRLIHSCYSSLPWFFLFVDHPVLHLVCFVCFILNKCLHLHLLPVPDISNTAWYTFFKSIKYVHFPPTFKYKIYKSHFKLQIMYLF